MESRTTVANIPESKSAHGSSRFRMLCNSTELRLGTASLLSSTQASPTSLANQSVLNAAIHQTRTQPGQEADAKLLLEVCNLYPPSSSFQETSF